MSLTHYQSGFLRGMFLTATTITAAIAKDPSLPPDSAIVAIHIAETTFNEGLADFERNPPCPATTALPNTSPEPPSSPTSS